MLKRVIGLAGVVVMLAAAAVVVPQRGTADSTKDVLVVNASNQPVPVSGNVAIGGTANVNVTNTPNVNVASLPAVQLAAGTNVGISGTPNVNVASLPAIQLASGASVNTHDLNSAGVNPFQIDVNYFGTDDGTPRGGGTENTFAVPANGRLVIDSFSMYAEAAPGSTDVELVIQVTAGGQTVAHVLGGRAKPAPAFSAADVNYFVSPLEKTSIVADGGSTVTIWVRRDGQPAPRGGYYNEVTFIGHFVTSP